MMRTTAPGYPQLLLLHQRMRHLRFHPPVVKVFIVVALLHARVIHSRPGTFSQAENSVEGLVENDILEEDRMGGLGRVK